MHRHTRWLTLLIAVSIQGNLQAAETREADIVIYGGTSAGVIAAIQADDMGHSVILIEPGQHLGGLTISGLGWTDSGNKDVIGGLSREFYQRIKTYYDDPATWVHESREGYDRYRADDDAMWTFEPHVAEQIYLDMLSETDVEVILGERLNRDGGATFDGLTLQAIEMESGLQIAGRIFIDATYEGDLMALAGVTYHVGRESNDIYGETLNGIQTARAVSHQFVRDVDPFVVPGDATSGLLPGVANFDGSPDGTGDHRVQTYNFRICMTTVESNRIPFEQPADYAPALYELLLRNFEAGDMRLPLKIDMMPNIKTDVNNNHAVSTDFIGMNYEFPEADYATREDIIASHESYIRGLMWTLAYHERVPAEIRNQVSRWGLARDEFVDNNNWPYWMYIREARRMVGEYVQTELDCRRIRMCEDSIGMGSYNMDSHNCMRYVDADGHVRNEGDIQVSPRGPYLISYRATLPCENECQNLLVPVCLSSSHMAYGSIRMEPVFMVLGQSAATAASLSLEQGIPLRDLEYADLRDRLLADGQVLDIPEGSVTPTGTPISRLDGIVIDDVDATKTGTWIASSSVNGFVGDSYLHDNAENDPAKSIRFETSIADAGDYEVRFSYTANPNRASNVQVTITSAGGDTSKTVDQTRHPPIDGMFVSLGTFAFGADDEVAVTISNAGANGHVIADCVQFLKK